MKCAKILGLGRLSTLSTSVQLFNTGGNNQTKSILKDISHISFPRLKALSVSQNCINSVEILQRIHFPCLEELDVSNNCITALRSVRKCVFLPNLKEISIGTQGF